MELIQLPLRAAHRPNVFDEDYPVAWTMWLPEPEEVTEKVAERADDVAGALYGARARECLSAIHRLALLAYSSRPDAHVIANISEADPNDWNSLGDNHIYLRDDAGAQARLEIRGDNRRISLRPFDGWIR